MAIAATLDFGHGLAPVYTGLSIGSTMIGSTRFRRDEFQTPRSSGATDGQVSRAVATDALLVVALGIGLAMTTKLTVLIGYRLAMAQLCRPLITSLPWPVLGAVKGICGIVAALPSVVPAAVMLRSSSRASSDPHYVG
ncbi:hypothetical protein AB8O38_10325 [Saccharomonospora xinjiangensis]|uniref:hypothetical protein n=1 Tax=Saccharomonospora xinjiangensis TaxID=75294 RepID=UPI0035109094